MVIIIMISRKDLLDGFAFLAFAILLTSLTKQLSTELYLGFISPAVMFLLLVSSVAFSFGCATYVLIKGIINGFN